MTLLPGARLSAYEIIAPLGKGGMGEVYRAKDTRLDRQVAIKVLSEHLAQHADSLKRFEREAKLLASLSHPNIVSIYDVGTEQGISFVVMELLEGDTLRSRISQSALPWEKALQIAIFIADGLSAAHSKAVIHRDLKPANVFLTFDGQTKILDFGLARFQEITHEENLTELPTLSQLTHQGIVLGTTPYMSPEQIEGKSVDTRTDIFSFGCLLYEMITARRAFPGDSSSEVIAAILRDEPTKITGIPSELQHVITRCMEKNPEQRFQSARDLAFALREIQSTASTSPTVHLAIPRSHLRKTAAGIVFGIFAMVVLMVGLNVGGLRNRVSVKQQRTPIHSLAVLPLKNLSGDPNQEYFADGMTEELITSLARIEALRVISRTSVMEYKSTKKQLPEIAKELNVDAIVEGSVMRSGNRVRISAQLLQASTDTHLWAESYERDLSDILALQNEVAQSIANEVQIKLTPQDQARLAKTPTVNPEAYQAYLRGLYYFNDAEQSEQNVRLGIQMFERAVEFDPTFALAFTELSMMHSYIVGTGFDIDKDHLLKAKGAVDRAFALQPDLPEGHVALGYYHYWGLKDYDNALKEFAVAAKDLPNNTWVLLGIAYVVRRQGNFQSSINNMKKALELNPKDAETAGDLAMSYTITRRYSEAEYYCDLTRFLAPDVARAYQISAFNDWLWHGTTTKSALILQKMPKKQETTWSMGDLFWQHLHERQYQAALERLSSISEVPFKSRAELISRDELAGIVYQLMNEPVKARASFDRARLLLESELRKRPEDHRVHSSLGIVYAGLERKQDAIREAKFAIKLYPVLKDTYAAPYYVENLALVYVMTGEHELALDQIEYLLSIPSFFSVPLLQLDPRWDPLRNHRRYTQVIQKYKL